MNRRGSRSVSMQRERELSDKWCRTILSAVYLRCQASSSLQQRTIDMSSVLQIRNQLNEVTFLSTQDAAPTPAQKLASQQLLSSAAQLSVNFIAIISCVPPDHFNHRSTSRNPIPVIAIISYYPPNLPSDHPPALQWLTTPTTSVQLSSSFPSHGRRCDNIRKQRQFFHCPPVIIENASSDQQGNTRFLAISVFICQIYFTVLTVDVCCVSN